MTGPGPVVVAGDALLDRDVDGEVRRLAPDAPVPVLERARVMLRPGGAALAALLAAASGAEVVLLAPVGDDPASRSLLALLDGQVTVLPLPLAGPLAEKTRLRADGRSLLRVDGAGGAPQPVPPAGPGPGGAPARAIASAGVVLVSDYGRGVTTDPVLRAALAARATVRPLVWDPHPRGAAPVPGARLVTPNQAEALAAAGPLSGRPAAGLAAAAAAGRVLCRRWQADAVAVTLGPQGVLLARGEGTPLAVPGRPVPSADPCGAGDMFAAAVATALHRGALPSEAVTAAAEAAAGYLTDGGAAAVSRPAGQAGWPAGPDGPGASAGADGAAGTDRTAPAARRGRDEAPGDGAALAAAGAAGRVRATGGTVVAAGGCFDVLHAGHVSLLQAARALGDCLVVCLNSDGSVRRRKGTGRPLNPAADRAAVLRALDCVDDVVIFDEDTPLAVLDRLRPGIWVKGDDYGDRELPESALVGSWGGQVVTVPYLAGRSTTRLVSLAHAAGQAG
jgi:D-beta-D-heptose 7-phosphate kinase/D-beta-D-heptose 1-phosphate adenosyltransferase